MRTQLFYAPSTYGQYVHPDNKRVWTIVDQHYLLQAYDRGVLKKADMITYSARWNITTGKALSASAETDIELNSRYLDSSFKYAAIIPSFALILFFGTLVFLGNAQRQTIEAMTATIDVAIDGAHNLAGSMQEKLKKSMSGF